MLLYFIGQTFPLTSQLLLGAQITWKPEQYELYSSPLLFLLLLITAICPVANLFEKDRRQFWRKINVMLALSLIYPMILAFQNDIVIIEILGFWAVIFLILIWTDSMIHQVLFPLIKKEGRAEMKGRYSNLGSILIHIGLGLMALGIMGQETLSDTYELRLANGEMASIGDFQIKIQDSHQFISPEGTTISIADISVTENNERRFRLSPDLEFYPKMNMLYARPAIASNLKRDIQIILSNWQSGTDGKLDIHVSFNPLMIWIWIGGILMPLGGMLVLVQKRKK